MQTLHEEYQWGYNNRQSKISTLNNDEPIHQDTAILNAHVPDNRASEYMKQK